MEEVEMELMVKSNMAKVREPSLIPEEVVESEQDFVQGNE